MSRVDTAFLDMAEGNGEPPISFDEIRLRDLAAIRAKQAGGAILSEVELRRLKQAEEETTVPPVANDPLAPIWAKNQVELAKALGCNRKTIQRHLKIEGEHAPPAASSDGRYNVTAWQLWAHKEGLLGKTVAPTEDKQSLELEGIRLANEKKAIENAVRRGELLHVDEVCKVLTEMTGGFAQHLRGVKHTLSPQVAGSNIGEATKRIGREMELALGFLALGEWAKKKTFWSTVFVHLSALRKRFNLGDGLSDTF